MGINFCRVEKMIIDRRFILVINILGQKLNGKLPILKEIIINRIKKFFILIILLIIMKIIIILEILWIIKNVTIELIFEGLLILIKKI